MKRRPSFNACFAAAVRRHYWHIERLRRWSHMCHLAWFRVSAPHVRARKLYDRLAKKYGLPPGAMV